MLLTRDVSLTNQNLLLVVCELTLVLLLFSVVLCCVVTTGELQAANRCGDAAIKSATKILSQQNWLQLPFVGHLCVATKWPLLPYFDIKSVAKLVKVSAHVEAEAELQTSIRSARRVASKISVAVVVVVADVVALSSLGPLAGFYRSAQLNLSSFSFSLSLSLYHQYQYMCSSSRIQTLAKHAFGFAGQRQNWNTNKVARVAECQTRPIFALNWTTSTTITKTKV